MKKYFALLFIVLMLLSGCANQNGGMTESGSTMDSEITQEGALSDSEIELAAGGAVKVFGLTKNGYHSLSAVGDRLLLTSHGTEGTQITVLSGVYVPETTVSLGGDYSQGGFQTTDTGVVYYDADNKQAVYLNTQLQEIDRVQLPEELQGMPAFSFNGGEIFYCVGQDIYAMDAERGLTRLIRTHACKYQTLLGTRFEGELLICKTEDEEGQCNTLYISSQTGEVYNDDGTVSQLETYGNQYLTSYMDGITQQWIVGTRSENLQQIKPAETNIVSALPIGGVVGYSILEDNTLNMSYYDVTSGIRSGYVSLPGIGEPAGVWADRWSGYVWILVAGVADEPQRLLRWDTKLSPVSDETNYLSPVYTAQSPDIAGLQECQMRVDALNKKHGTTIRIWESASKNPPNMGLVAEYQTSAIHQCLDELEAVLDRLPENFIYKSVNRTVRICIVRSIDGEIDSAQCWYDKDAFIILSVGMDVEDAFINELGYVIDTRVLGNSAVLDGWTALNPEGFQYGNINEAYLQPEGRFFSDSEAMQSVTADRARVFWHAMQADNEQMFQSEAMQAKLLLLCKGIRDAWRWEQKKEAYPWEQYLTTPIYQ